MEYVMLAVDAVRRIARTFGPYLLLELLLPGGTIFALTLYLYRRRQST